MLKLVTVTKVFLYFIILLVLSGCSNEVIATFNPQWVPNKDVCIYQSDYHSFGGWNYEYYPDELKSYPNNWLDFTPESTSTSKISIGEICYSPDGKYYIVPVKERERQYLYFFKDSVILMWFPINLDGMLNLGWAPDSKKIAYIISDNELLRNYSMYDKVTLPQSNFDYGLYILELGKTVPVLVDKTIITNEDPIWLEDNKSVLYYDLVRNDIMVINTEDKSIKPITTDSIKKRSLVISHDRKRLLFLRNDQICVVNVDGTNEKQLTNKSTACFGPSWSPDDKKISFCSNNNLFTMQDDGSNQIQISDFDKSERCYAETSWSPSGRYIVCSYSVAEEPQMYVWDLVNKKYNKIDPGAIDFKGLPHYGHSERD